MSSSSLSSLLARQCCTKSLVFAVERITPNANRKLECETTGRPVFVSISIFLVTNDVCAVTGSQHELPKQRLLFSLFSIDLAVVDTIPEYSLCDYQYEVDCHPPCSWLDYGRRLSNRRAGASCDDDLEHFQGRNKGTRGGPGRLRTLSPVVVLQ